MYVILLYLLFCNILLPFMYCENASVIIETPKLLPKSDDKILQPQQTLSTETGILFMEGSILKNTSNKNPTSLLYLDQELVKSKEKPSVPRKGVNLNENNELVHEINNIKPETEQKQENNLHLLTSITHDKKDTVIPSNVSTNDSVFDEKTPQLKLNTSEIKHKKPSLLSYDALASMSSSVNPKSIDGQLRNMDVKNIVQNQSASKDNVIITKQHVNKANSHPALIMPVVITILVVPLFVVVGYMALQRGREAWKNRHYKRMDFLLDGMYND